MSSATIQWEEVVRQQGIYDACDFCNTPFFWLISTGSPVCPHCLSQLSRPHYVISQLKEKTDKYLAERTL